MSNSPSKGTALVTGASRGIGAVYADRLAKRGYDLILVGRSEAPLKALTGSLASVSGRHVTAIVADLNNKIDLAKVETKLREDSSITMLVNNAGAASVAPLLNADIEKMEEMIALNTLALTRLTYAAAPAFVKRGTGTIINISSVVGISPETLNGVYGATKAYVLAFSHSLQHELADKGIRVQAVLPGATATDLWEIAGLPWQKLPPSIVMSVEDMVDAALVGLDQGELVTIPSLHDGDEWTRFEAARRAISQRFGNFRARCPIQDSGPAFGMTRPNGPAWQQSGPYEIQSHAHSFARSRSRNWSPRKICSGSCRGKNHSPISTPSGAKGLRAVDPNRLYDALSLRLSFFPTSNR